MFADRPDLVHARATPAPALARIWRWADLVAGLALLLVAFGVIVAALALTRAHGEPAGVAGTLAFEVAIGGVVVLLALRRRLGPAALGFVWPRRWGPLGRAWLGAYGILIGYTVALQLLDALGLDVGRFRGGNPVPVRPGAPLALLAMLALTVVLIAPVSEELFFRALLYRGLRGFWRRVPALVVSGIVFGLFHLNVGVVVPFALIGVLFAWANEESGSLVTSIAAHALVNGLSFALSVAGVGE